MTVTNSCKASLVFKAMCCADGFPGRNIHARKVDDRIPTTNNALGELSLSSKYADCNGIGYR
jgi:hypothetical protein